MSFIIVAIPSQGPPTAWFAKKEQDIIAMACVSASMTYQEWDLESALDCFGEREDIPVDLLEILESDRKAIDFSYCDGANVQYFKIGDAPSELEAAKEALFHDLDAGFVLNEDGARRFVSGNSDLYLGHHYFKAQTVVDKVLSDYF